MKIKHIIQAVLAISVFSLSSLSFADKQITTTTVVTSTPATKKTSSLIEFYEKDFSFNWNDYTTIKANKTKIKKIEAFLKTIPENPDFLSPENRLALGKLLYKLGTFYTHIARNPDLAIEKLNAANTYFTSKEDKAWTDNQLAYAYEQKFASSHNDADKEKALAYTNKVISNKKTDEVAFAECVKGLVLNDAKQFPQAETSFNKALKIYSSQTSDKNHDQYARAKNRLANIILDEGRDKEALSMLQELKEYWAAKSNNSQNPYAARNLVSLAQAYLKNDDAGAARDELNNAIQIDKDMYGDKSPQLAQPYELLSDAYTKLGNRELAKSYKSKAAALDRD
jgi:tetratricopeptide (TPR) repeat protein